jgi:hypothetical protein
MDKYTLTITCPNDNLRVKGAKHYVDKFFAGNPDRIFVFKWFKNDDVSIDVNPSWLYPSQHQDSDCHQIQKTALVVKNPLAYLPSLLTKVIAFFRGILQAILQRWCLFQNRHNLYSALICNCQRQLNNVKRFRRKADTDLKK